MRRGVPSQHRAVEPAGPTAVGPWRANPERVTGIRLTGIGPSKRHGAGTAARAPSFLGERTDIRPESAGSIREVNATKPEDERP